MKKENHSLPRWTKRRMKSRMLRGVYEENLSINGRGTPWRRPPRRPTMLLKGAALFALLISFTVYRNSDLGDYHTLPALPLARYTTIFPDSPPNVPFVFERQPAGGEWGEYQPLLNQNDISLRRLFGLQVRTIVIDPGHGGADPGTLGGAGSREKDITLDIARRLQRRLGQYDGLGILLTRSEDDTLSLAERIDFANSHRADLFVSIHLNNIPDKPYSIIETYYFGPNRDQGALALAERENSGSPYAVSDFQVMLQKITNTLKYQEAKALARAIQKSLYGSVQRDHDRVYDYGVKTAPFVVLLGVDMPSVLTEVTCLSDPEEEKKLQSEAYREEIARCIETGVIRYLKWKGNPNQSEV
jgi:N-acetylmuramoyl-L-alanine amidase